MPPSPARVAASLAMVTMGALALAPALASAAPGDLAYVEGAAGCWKAPGQESTGCGTASPGLEAPASVLVTPDGRSVYVGGGRGQGSGRIAAFSRDTASGRLTLPPGTAQCITPSGSSGACTADALLDEVTGLAASPDGATVYVTVNDPATTASDGVLVLSRNVSTGALTRVGCVTAAGGAGCSAAAWVADAASVAVSPDGRSVYVGTAPGGAGDGEIGAFSRNASTGLLTVVAGAGNACVSTTGTHAGACTQVPSFQLWNPRALEVTHDGTQVIAAHGGGVSILTRHAGTGALSSPGSGPLCLITDAAANGNPCARSFGLWDNTDVALSPDGTSIYGVSARADADSGMGVLRRDAATGLVSVPAGTGSCLTQSGGAFQWPGTSTTACGTGRYTAATFAAVVSADGRNVYSVSEGDGGAPITPAIDVFTRDVTTGALSQQDGPAGCLGQTGYGGACLADTTHAMSLMYPRSIAISPDGATVYVADQGRWSLLVLDRAPHPTTPSGGGAAPAPAGGASSGPAHTTPAPSAPRRLAGALRVKRGVATTTGTVPQGAVRVTQAARARGGPKRATGRCTVRKMKYTCSVRLSQGTWTVTTTARGRAGVVAQGTRRVVVP